MLTLKKTSLQAWFVIVIVFLIPLIVWSYSSNPPLSRTGAPGEGTCGSCHSGGIGGGHVSIASASGNTYTPGVKQRLTVTITDGNASAWGYEMTAVQASATSTGAGTFTAADTNSSVRTSGTKSYAAQTNDFPGTTGSLSYAVDWTPPASNVGNVTVYAAGVGADNSGDTSGDSVYTTNLSLTPATSGTPALSLSPSTLNFSYQVGGNTPATQSVSVSSSGTALSYTVTTSATWLTATPASGTTPGSVSVGLNTSGLTAGTYNGTVTVTAAGASNSPQTASVKLTVTSSTTPSLSLSPTALNFSYQIGGTKPSSQNVNVSSSGSMLSYTVGTSATWLTASPASGSTPGSVSVGVNTTGVTAGTYNGTVTVTAGGASNSPQVVNVSFTVTAATPNLTLSPTTLAFNYQAGGTAPAVQYISTGSTGAALSYTVSSSATWLTASPASGSTPGTVSVGINTSGLSTGSYNGTVTVTAGSAGNSPQRVNISLNVTAAGPPSLVMSPSTLTFGYLTGGNTPAAQTVSVTSSGTSALSYTVATSAAWLSATPANGTTPGTVSVSVNPAGLAVGTYSGTVTLTASGAANSPASINVTFNVTSTPPRLRLSPGAFTFTYTVGGTLPASQSLSITSGGVALGFSVSTSSAWLTATPASGTTGGTISLGVNPAGLVAGSYSGAVTITAPGASNSPQTVGVSLNVSGQPNLTLSPGTLTFTYQTGGSTPPTQAVSVSSSSGALSYTTATSANWLTASPASGNTPGTVNVGVNPSGLSAGTYNGTVTLTAAAAGNSPQKVNVTLTVSSGAPGLSLSPTSLSFSYQSGGFLPSAKSVAVSSNGTALSYNASTSAGWLSASPPSGSTPGTLSVSVSPSGLAAGTYTGTVSVTASGAANSPQQVSVTLTVTAAVPNLRLSPGAFTFNFKSGGTNPAAQTLTVSSTGTALNYIVSTAGSWLSATPGSGTTTGTVNLSVNPSGLAVGTYSGSVSISSSGAGNSPQTVGVTLIVSAAAANLLQVSARTLSMQPASASAAGGGFSQTLAVTSTTQPVPFTAEALGGSWLSVSPAGGTTSGEVTVTAAPEGLAKGKYTAQVRLSAPGLESITVPVTFTVPEESARTTAAIRATTYVHDPADTGAVAAEWVNGAGVPAIDPEDRTNQGLLLVNNAAGGSKARAGVTLHNVEGTTLTALGFDIREGSLCTLKGPRFVVVTSDDVVHMLGGCNLASAQPAPAKGWKRFRFDSAKAAPAIAQDATVKSIALVLDDGPDADGGMVVVDNINVNGNFVGHE